MILAMKVGWIKGLCFEGQDLKASFMKLVEKKPYFVIWL